MRSKALWTIKRGLPADPNERHVLNRFIVGKRPVEALRVAASSNKFAEWINEFHRVLAPYRLVYEYDGTVGAWYDIQTFFVSFCSSFPSNWTLLTNNIIWTCNLRYRYVQVWTSIQLTSNNLFELHNLLNRFNNRILFF